MERTVGGCPVRVRLDAAAVAGQVAAATGMSRVAAAGRRGRSGPEPGRTYAAVLAGVGRLWSLVARDVFGALFA